MATDTKLQNEWTLEIKIEDYPEPLRVFINPHQELLIGRLSPEQAEHEVLDLSPFGGADSGVSRQHADIRWEEGHLVITDLNSDNGTVLNGVKLQPDVTYRLNNGDALFLGHLKMALTININLGQGSVRAKRMELDTLNVPIKGRGQRILVVEDDAQLSKLYQVLIEESGYTAHICRDVVSAIRVLNQQTAPAAILLDLKLPGVYGIELCRYVRRDTECPDIPIVVASALSDEETIRSAMHAGADVFVTKPFRPQELIRIIGAVVFRFEKANPSMSTKKLAGTASLDFVAANSRNDTIVIFVDGYREPIGTVIENMVTLGRGNPGGPVSRTYIDLAEYGAFDKGVSRVHAKIKRQGKNFTVEDMDSANGTFVNGHSVTRGETYPLKNGDEIRLGELRMHVYLLAETEVAQR